MVCHPARHASLSLRAWQGQLLDKSVSGVCKTWRGFFFPLTNGLPVRSMAALGWRADNVAWLLVLAGKRGDGIETGAQTGSRVARSLCCWSAVLAAGLLLRSLQACGAARQAWARAERLWALGWPLCDCPARTASCALGKCCFAGSSPGNAGFVAITLVWWGLTEHRGKGHRGRARENGHIRIRQQKPSEWNDAFPFVRLLHTLWQGGPCHIHIFT